MATLTETAFYSRKIIKYCSLGLVAFLILRSLFLSFTTYWKNRHPKPPPPPTVAFGKLPKLKFPARPNLPPIGLRQETVTGSLPPLATQAKVFFISQTATNLLAWDNTKAWAKKLGFSREPETTDKFSLKFVTDSSPRTTLDVNVLTKNFELVYDWKNDLQILSEANLPSENEAVSLAKAFLQGAGVLNPDLSSGKTQTIYYKYNEGNLIKALYLSEANFIKVNFFRKDIESFKILPANPLDSNVYVLLSSSKEKSRGIIEVKYFYYPNSERFETYPLKDVNTAWTQLTSGKGFIANLGNNPNGKITIRNAYLAYYDNAEAQNFLQPVIVFEGDNDFYAYVPAITDNWTEQ